jgi:deoxyribose-phosphate aldolase
MVKIAHSRGRKVKASGGIRDASAAKKFVSLGADRLGETQRIAFLFVL